MQKPRRYIGMTGFSSRAQVEEVLASRPPQPEEETNRSLVMVGVLASDKSLNKRLLDQPKRYPPPEALSGIFVEGEYLLNLLHVNAPREALLETMLKARELAGNLCHGMQVNKTWPDPGIFEEYLRHYPGEQLVLQCGSSALEEIGYSMPALASRVAEYTNLAAYVLIDPSGGRGTPFDVPMAHRCFAALQDLPFGLAIAGGLSSSNLHKIHRLKEFGKFSIDAESGLRNDEDEFIIRYACNYLAIATTVFAERVDHESRVSMA